MSSERVIIDTLFGKQARELRYDERKKRIVATLPTDDPKRKYTSYDPKVKNLFQVDWSKSENKGLMAMVEREETEALLLNKNFPGYKSERIYPEYREDQQTKGILLEEASETGAENTKRLAITDVFLEEEIDFSILDRFHRIPLDPDLRVFFLGVERISPKIIERYLDVMPDKLVNGKLNERVADVIVSQLLDLEQFVGDEDSESDVTEFYDDRAIVSRIEEKIFTTMNIFNVEQLEGFARSSFDTMRSTVACLPGLSSRAALLLSFDDDDKILRQLATCTTSCNALEGIELNDNASRGTLMAASRRKNKLDCK